MRITWSRIILYRCVHINTRILIKSTLIAFHISSHSFSFFFLCSSLLRSQRFRSPFDISSSNRMQIKGKLSTFTFSKRNIFRCSFCYSILSGRRRPCSRIHRNLTIIIFIISSRNSTSRGYIFILKIFIFVCHIVHLISKKYDIKIKTQKDIHPPGFIITYFRQNAIRLF